MTSQIYKNKPINILDLGGYGSFYDNVCNNKIPDLILITKELENNPTLSNLVVNTRLGNQDMLSCSKNYGHVEVVKTLIQYGADLKGISADNHIIQAQENASKKCELYKGYVSDFKESQESFELAEEYKVDREEYLKEHKADIVEMRDYYCNMVDAFDLIEIMGDLSTQDMSI